MLRFKALLALFNALINTLGQALVCLFYFIVMIALIAVVYYLKAEHHRTRLNKLYQEATTRCRFYLTAVHPDTLIESVQLIKQYTDLELHEVYALVSTASLSKTHPAYVATMPLDLAQALKKELAAIGSDAHIEEIMTLS